MRQDVRQVSFPFSRSVLLLIFLMAVAQDAAAHGGAFFPPAKPKAGPGSAGPPSGVGPSAPKTSSPRAARSAASGSGGVSTATRSGAQTAARRQGASASSAGTARGRDAASWEFWWDANRDRFLKLRQHLGERKVLSGSVGALTGRGRKTLVANTHGASHYTVKQVVIPHLLQLLEQSDEQDVLDSAVLAACRAAPAGARDSVREAVIPLLAHNLLSVQSSATLALGALGDDAVRDELRSLLRNDAHGRALAGGAVASVTRAFAALALGLNGCPVDARMLADLVQRLPDAERDVKTCCIVALGLIGAKSDVSTGVTAVLEELLRDRTLDYNIQSKVPTALARTGNRAVLPSLLDVFEGRDTGTPVRRATAIAMGRLARPSDTNVVDALLRCLEKERDEHVRHFSLLALAEIGGRKWVESEEDDPDAETDLRARILDRIEQEVEGKGRSFSQRSWGALAAGLYGRTRPEALDALVVRLSSAYEDEHDPAFRSAFAIGLGLLGDPSVGKLIHDDLDEVKDSRFRGHACVALGLLGHQPAAEDIRRLCADRTSAAELRVESAIALGLLRDPRSVQVLISALEEGSTLEVTAGLAKALGLIGNDAAVEPLRALSMDSSRPAISRGFACVALGLLAARTELPFQAAVLAHEDYLSDTAALAELRSIL